MISNLLRIWEVVSPYIEILILWYVIYVFLAFIKGTRTVQVLKGLFILVVAFLLSEILDLKVINWILTRIFTIAVVALLIIFQPELRRGLARLGQSSFFGGFLKENKIIEEVVKSVVALSRKRIGAIIALERKMGLRTYIESGISIGSRVKSELINTIFMPNTPLHDGGIVIRENRIQAAGCLFPLTENPNISKTLGTRHRAALGLSEETDAIVIVVSEETGIISLAVSGRLIRNLNEEALRKTLNKLYVPEKRVKSLTRQLVEQEGIDEEDIS